MTDRPMLDSFDNSGPAIYDAAERSAYAVTYLRDNTRIGFTDERGPAWHADQTIGETGQPAYLLDGTHFPGPVPMEEVEKLLSITLEERPLFYAETVGEYPNGEPIVEYKPVQRFKGIGIVGRDDIVNAPRPNYQIHQYMSALHGFVQAVTDGSADVASVGILKHGAVAFLQAVLSGDWEVSGGGEPYKYVPYITAGTSADSSLADIYLTGFTGAVCDNTFDQAMNKALTKFKVKHTKHAKVKTQEARDKLGLRLAQVGEETAETIEGLMGIEVTERDWELWLDEVVPMPEFKETKKGTGGRGFTMAENKRDALDLLWRKDKKVAPWSGTAFGVLQAWNTWGTWQSTVRNAEGGRIERNYLNALEGKVAKSDGDALIKLAEVQERRLVLA